MKEPLRGGSLFSLVALAAGCLLLAGSSRSPRFSFRGKVVVITGGSRGLGLALARELASQGAVLALLARDAEELKRAAVDLRLRGARGVTLWTCDLLREEEIHRTIEAIAEREGRIDVVVNNAGIMLVAPLEKMKPEDFEEAMKLHFWAPYHVTMAALRYLKRHRESRVINISSFGGKVAVPHMAPYCTSKFALVGLSDALRAELAKFGVRVTTVCPGLMRTGSHINASFKGSHRKEFAWFSMGAAMPVLSIAANRAARKIVNAARRGQSTLVITLPARAAVVTQALFPGLIGGIMKVVNALLPKPTVGSGAVYQGFESGSALSPSPLTTLADQASAEFNEIPAQGPKCS